MAKYILLADALKSIITAPDKTADEKKLLVARLQAIPAADVRPVGRWIEIDDYVLCANCGVAEHSPNRNYCHCCGADMRPETPEESQNG